MALGVAGNFKNPRDRTKANIISVEIAAECSLACPECLTGNRRLYVGKIEEEQNRYARHKNLTELLINYFPTNAVPVFIGLGEPTTEQDAIIEFHNQRKDITKSHIQTNGGYKLKPSLAKLLESGIVTVGLSYDKMHKLGGQKTFSNLAIQPEYVTGIATAIDGDEAPIEGLNNHFKNLDRILVHPAINEHNEYKITWARLKESIADYAKKYANQAIYTDLSDFFEPTNKTFYEQANKELVKQTGEDWKFQKELGFYVYAPQMGNNIRILINGTYTTTPEESAHASWEKIKENTFPITDLPKFDAN